MRIYFDDSWDLLWHLLADSWEGLLIHLLTYVRRNTRVRGVKKMKRGCNPALYLCLLHCYSCHNVVFSRARLCVEFSCILRGCGSGDVRQTTSRLWAIAADLRVWSWFESSQAWLRAGLLHAHTHMQWLALLAVNTPYTLIICWTVRCVALRCACVVPVPAVGRLVGLRGHALYIETSQSVRSLAALSQQTTTTTLTVWRRYTGKCYCTHSVGP